MTGKMYILRLQDQHLQIQMDHVHIHNKLNILMFHWFHMKNMLYFIHQFV